MAFFPLSPGDTIGVFSPSSYVTQDQLAPGVALLEQAGFRVFVHPQTFARHHQSAGTSAEKVAALHALYADPQIRAVFAAGGGNRALHLLDQIDYNLVKKHPKPLIGFSDVTSLLNAFWVKTGQEQIHAPVLKLLKSDSALPHLTALLTGKPLSYHFDGSTAFTPGTAKGPVIGGNLSVFHHLIGTDFMPDTTGAILLLEDINEELSHLDRALGHLRLLGVFERLSGVIIGGLTDLTDTGSKPFGFSLRDILQEHLAPSGIPVALGLPFGHDPLNEPLPIGRTIELEITKTGVKILVP